MNVKLLRFGLAALAWMASVAAARADQALCVGVQQYPNLDPKYTLQGCANDARDWANKLRELGFNVRLLTNEQGTRRGILDAIAEVRARIQPNERFVFFFAGHGTDRPRPAILPYDSRPGSAEGDVSADDLYQAVKAVQARSRTVILDACFSGGMAKSIIPELGFRPRFYPRPGPREPEKATGQDISPRLVKGTEICYYTAASGSEVALEANFGADHHGVFSYTTLPKLRSADQLWGDVHRAVAKDVERLLVRHGYSQHPTLSAAYVNTFIFTERDALDKQVEKAREQEEAARKAAEEAAARKAREDEARRIAEEEARQKAEEEKAAREAARLAAMQKAKEEAERREQERIAAEKARKEELARMEAERQRRIAEEARRKAEAAENERRRRAAEKAAAEAAAAAKKKEQEALRAQREQEAAAKAAEEARQEAARLEAERKKQQEAARLAAEEKARREQEAEQKRQAAMQEEERLRKAEEEARKLKEESEARLKPVASTLADEFASDHPDPEKVRIAMEPDLSEIPLGQELTFKVQTGMDGFLIVLERTVEKKYQLLFPASRQIEHAAVSAGGVVRIPEDLRKVYKPGQTGTERVKAILYTSREKAMAVLAAAAIGEGGVDGAALEAISVGAAAPAPFYTSTVSFAVVDPNARPAGGTMANRASQRGRTSAR